MAEPFNIFNYARKREREDASGDPVIQHFQKKRNTEASLYIQDKPDPQREANVNRVARRESVNPAIADESLNVLETRYNASRMIGLMNDYDGIGKWAANKRNAAAASDDYDSLSLLGKLWYNTSDFVLGVPGAIETGTVGAGQMGDDFFQELDRFNRFVTYPLRGALSSAENAVLGTNALDPDRAAKDSETRYTARAAGRETYQGESRPDVNSPTVQSLLSGVESVPLTLTAVATRNANAGSALIGTLVGAGETQRGRQAGLSGVDALRFGVTQGAIETATERMPVGKLISDLAKKTPFAQTFVNQLVREIPGEQAATVLQDLNDWAVLNPDKTMQEFLEERPTAAVDTLVQTIGGVGTTTAITSSAQRTVEAGVKLSRKVTEAKQAKAGAEFAGRLNAAMQQSKLRGRDPEAFKELIKQMADDNAVEDVYIPAEQLTEYMQSDGYLPDSSEAEWLSNQDFGDEAATGGDLIVPVEELSEIAGTSLFERMKEHMRFSAGGMSEAEANTFESEMSDVMAELAESAAQDEQATPRDDLAQSITDKLMNAGFTPTVAAQQAELLATRYATRSERLGQELTGKEFDPIEVNQVLPESLAKVQEVDNLDIVINALRSATETGSPNGPSLLDWIAKEGGIEDRGGDLKSMGADKWHKDKSFRKKLLRDFDPDQASMLGADDQQNSNSLDNMALRAWEAGFFPDLTERPTTNDMLEAIGEGIAGRDRFAESQAPDDVRLAADDLARILDQTGLDQTASNQDIKQALAQYSQEAEGQGFDQAPSVESDAFKAWFGDSKVVDDQGNPLVVYHGTKEEFEAFDISKIGATATAEGYGFYFAENADVAKGYDGGSGQVMETYLSIKNPVDSGQAALSREETAKMISAAVEAEIAKYPDEIEDYRDSFLSNVADTYSLGRDDSVNEFVDILMENDTVVNQIAELANIMGSKELAFEAARLGANIDGILVEDFQEGDGPVWLAFRPEQIKSVNNRGTFDPSDPRILYQSFADGPRGRLIFPETGFEGQATIDLFEERNLSTFLHETGHLWLEELRMDAATATEMDGVEAKQLFADWSAVKAWFKRNGHEVKDGVIPAEAHEMWARGVERYLMEGKAPTKSLQGIFETFRSWMISIYKTVESLRSPVTPEIREVMDRLVATDNEIIEAREAQKLDALFSDAAEAGMTGKEFAAYTKLTSDARNAAQTTILEKSMRSIRWKHKKENSKRIKAAQEEATEFVDALPEFKALKAVTADKMDKEWITQSVGQDAIKLLPRGVTKNGGSDPDVMAEINGFQSGDDMLRKLMGMEDSRRKAKEGGDKRSLRKIAIDEEANRIVRERYGDVMNDGSIEEEAIAAVHNDAQGEVISAEIRSLGRRTGQRATPYALAKDWARGKIRSGEVRYEASRSAIQRYTRSANRASKEAEKAMIAQDFEAVFRHKQTQMVNNALVSEAKAALQEVEIAVRRLDKIARSKTRKSVDQEYMEQAHALLENVDLRPRTQTSIDREGQFSEWAKARTEEGFDVVVPDTFEATLGKTNWSRLSVENLLGLDEAVKQIMHLGRLKQGLIDNKERREFDAVVQEAVDSIGNLKKKPPTDMTEPTKWDRFKSGAANVDASLLKMETVFDWLDGSGDGAFNRVAFQPIAEAQNEERLLLNKHITELQELLQAIPKDDIRRWARKVSLDLIDRETGAPVTLTHDQLISMALNMGNASNATKLAGGYGWSEAGIMAALNQELSEADWQYVQNVWDAINTLWPKIEALEKRLNGVVSEKIEARSLQTAFGTLKGGYFPVIYDPARDYKTEEQQAVAGDKLFENTHTRATTSKGFTKERTNVERPIHLSLGVINRHVAEVIHDVTHREAVMQAYKFLNNNRIKRAVDSTLGPEIRKQFNPWLKHIANEWAIDRAGLTGLEGFLKKMRTNTTIVGMGYRFSTMIMQLAGYTNSFERVGMKHVVPHIRDLLNKDKVQFVLDKSMEVRGRMETLDRDIRDNMKASMGRDYTATGVLKYVPREISKLPDDVKKFAFHGIGWMDRIVVVPTWLGEYNKQLDAGKTEDQAIHAADKAVRQSQGAGGAKDLASVQRGRGASGEAIKLLTMFYSYMSAFYQRQRNLGRDIGSAARDRDASKAPELMARSFWIMMVAPVLAELLSDRGPEEDEDPGMWAFQMMLFHMFGPIPIFRDFGPEAIKAATDQKTFGYQFTPATGGVETLVNVGRDVGNIVEGDDTKRATRNAMESIGYITGKIPGQFAASTQFLVDVGYGEQDPEDISEWFEGLTKGKIKD